MIPTQASWQYSLKREVDMGESVKMTPLQHDTIESLRGRGFAVVVFYPKELEGVDALTLEERLVEFGNQAIDNLKETTR